MKTFKNIFMSFIYFLIVVFSVPVYLLCNKVKTKNFQENILPVIVFLLTFHIVLPYKKVKTLFKY